MVSFEKPSSVKKFSQDLLAEVKHRTKYGACKVINVLKHGVCRFFFFFLQAPVGIAALEHLKSTQRTRQKERKQRAPNQHHLIAIAGELSVTTNYS